LIPVVVILMAAAAGASSAAIAGEDSVPVLVELFTSEGCSSCPPADTLLIELNERQPIPGVTVISLSEHVDYWNRLGWVDPFSREAFTERQEGYAHAARTNRIYTPQAVVEDGLVSQVTRGENEGRSLAHAAVTRRLERIGKTSSSGGFRGSVVVDSVGDPAATRVVVFAQRGAGRVVAIGRHRWLDSNDR
jgi:hypothetical protein